MSQILRYETGSVVPNILMTDTLAAWLIPSETDRAVVLLHGIHSFGWDGAAPDITRALVRAGFHVLILDLRGHGGSGSTHLGLGWHERRDVRAAVDLLLARGFGPGKIGLHGTSYGAATALLSAAVIREIGAVVADSAFADTRELMTVEIEKMTGVPAFLVMSLQPGMSILSRLIYGLDLASITPLRAVPAIAPRPILFIHGGEDNVISPKHSRRLMDQSNNPGNELWIIPGLRHTEAVHTPGDGCGPSEFSAMREVYLQRITSFFHRTLR